MDQNIKKCFKPNLTRELHTNLQDSVCLSKCKDKFTNKHTLSDKNYRALNCLIDNGIEADEAEIVLQALEYILLDEELFFNNQKTKNTQIWKIPVQWTESTFLNIEANTLDEAIAIARSNKNFDLIEYDTHYIEDSWDVPGDTNIIRRVYNNNQPDKKNNIYEMSYSEFSQYINTYDIKPLISYENWSVYEINGHYYLFEHSVKTINNIFHEIELIATLLYNKQNDIIHGAKMFTRWEDIFNADCCGETDVDENGDMRYLWFKFKK